MRDNIKNLIATSFEFIRLPYLRLKKLKDKLLVLTYHGVMPEKYIEKDHNYYAYRNVVSVEHFSQQVKFLKDHFHVVSLDELESEYLLKSNKPKVLITFDDGFQNNYQYAFPVLAENHIPGHFFVTTGFIEDKKLLWTDQVTYLLLNTKRREFYLPDFFPQKLELNSVEQRINASLVIRGELKKLTFERLKEVLHKLNEMFDDVDLSQANPVRYRFMNWSEIKQMANEGMIIGSHTHNHALINVSDEVFFEKELNMSIEYLKKKANINCAYLAYPNGTINDYQIQLFPLLKKLGFKYALTQIPEWNTLEHIRNHPYELYRLNIPNLAGVNFFKAYITKLWFRRAYD
ncbi:MAG: hypothetical protein D6748_11725 [Calditrichaeota bacterium]|nr:MAG: hypothetical protein D6748_11725 [Calditrichota bacterium]